ncbi:uncharacterized protein N7529_010004 [Penicillium soppii]|uniref:uncharacterized protein n=1 Tax=Penicillium soppii TaxID=69789 RepID=UPI002547AC5E|nr:uncharacterized protein N7529_010004 [Penicillium soppii]KAJ5856060.1 hypothetical protein N7529_010004 [Penicillium soppii]
MAGVCISFLLLISPVTFIRKNTVLLTTAFAGAFAFELAFDIGSNKIWDTWNQGVCDLLSPFRYLAGPRDLCNTNRTHTNSHVFTQRQWKDIKHRYMVKEEEDDE